MPAKTIAAVLRTVGNDYAHAYAVAIAQTELFPEALNGLIATLFKAIAEARYDEALSITEDATIFLYALAAASIGNDIDDIRHCIKHLYGPMPDSLQDRLAHWRRARKTLVRGQPTKRIHCAAARKTVEDGAALLQKLLAEYNVAQGGATNLRGRTRWARIKLLLVGPMSAFLAGTLIDAYFAELQSVLSRMLG
jgi:hypothetical protein